jgi:hypothetical protein
MMPASVTRPLGTKVVFSQTSLCPDDLAALRQERAVWVTRARRELLVREAAIAGQDESWV